MKRIYLIFFVALMPLLTQPLTARAGEDGDSAPCDFPYTVQRGDTLSAIARGAYGTSNYWPILLRNPKVRGRTDTLFAGERLIMPCLGGPNGQAPNREALEAQSGIIPPPAPAGQAGRKDTGTKIAKAEPGSPAAEAEAPNAPPSPAREEIEDPKSGAETGAPTEAPPNPRFLTRAGQSPFADETLQDGAAITALITRAFERSEGGAAPDVVFEKDPGKNLIPLMLEGAFDIAFPWVRPACDAPSTAPALRPEEALLCRWFVFSAPYYESIIGVFKRQGEGANEAAPTANTADRADEVSNICNASDLPRLGTDRGAGSGNETIETCLRQLITGVVDEVHADVFATEAAIERLQMQDQVMEIPALSHVLTLHAVAPKSKTEAVALLSRLDAALAEMKEEGEWISILRRYFN